MEILEDEENQIESVLFKLLDIPDEEEEEEEPIEGIDGNLDGEKDSKMSGIGGDGDS